MHPYPEPMPSTASSTASASLWLKTFFGGFAIICAMVASSLLTPVPYGDLSRIGRLSDAEFGWRRPPPPAPSEALKAVPLNEADVLVVGDSFSMTLYWQAALVQDGLRVATIYWGQINYLCQDFSSWISAAGFKGRLVVIESVERLLDERLEVGESEQCARLRRAPIAKTAPFFDALTKLPESALNWNAKLNTGLTTYRNTRRARESAGDTQHGKDVLVRRVADGCRQFSHRLCDRALFFKDDLDNGPLSTKTFERLKRFTAAQSLPLLWMVIPNKTTVYVDPDYSRPFVEAFQGAGYGPDLFMFAQEQRRRMTDFYFPNDTHVSMHGQLALGQLMLEQVRERLRTLPVKAP